MSKFRVTFTQCNTYSYEVDANNKTDAKHKAYDKFVDNLRYFKPDAEYDKVEIEVLKDGKDD